MAGLGTATFTDMIAAAYSAGARISSNSWGAFAGGYTIEAQEYDARVRDALPDTPGNQGMLFVFSAGNFGSGQTISSPGTAKNVITVGASESSMTEEVRDGCGTTPKDADDAEDIAFFSSGGPTYDGAAKPDLVAPGTHILGLASRADEFDGSEVCGVKGSPYFPEGQTTYTISSTI